MVLFVLHLAISTLVYKCVFTKYTNGYSQSTSYVLFYSVYKYFMEYQKCSLECVKIIIRIIVLEVNGIFVYFLQAYIYVYLYMCKWNIINRISMGILRCNSILKI